MGDTEREPDKPARERARAALEAAHREMPEYIRRAGEPFSNGDGYITRHITGLVHALDAMLVEHRRKWRVSVLTDRGLWSEGYDDDPEIAKAVAMLFHKRNVGGEYCAIVTARLTRDPDGSVHYVDEKTVTRKARKEGRNHART